MAELYRYAAFISYSSKDARFAQRLHRALERYGIPSSLGKFDLIGGGKRNRIYPVFRDREELSAGQLGEQIEANLKASAALIVVCSPNAAVSPWVEKEIEFFAGLGRHAKIFSIISDDAPLVDASGADATMSCFPPAFRGDALAGDKLEPLAADARKGKDGFRNAWLKVVAGLIGVNPGRLADRDRAARRAAFAQRGLLAATLLVALLAAGSWILSRQLQTRSDTLAELARAANDAGRYEMGARYAVAAMAGTDWPVIGFDSENAELQLARAVANAPPLVLVAPANGYPVSAIAFVGTGTHLAVASRDQHIRIWNVATGQQAREPIDAVINPERPLTFDNVELEMAMPIGVVVRQEDGLVGVDLNSGEVAWSGPRGDESILAGLDFDRLSIGGEGRRIAFARSYESDSSVYGYDSAGGSEVRFTGHAQPPSSVAMSGDGAFVLSGSADATARLWRFSDGRQLAVLQHTSPVVKALLASRAFRALTVTRDGGVTVWDLQSHAALFSLPGGNAPAQADIAARGDLLVATRGQGLEAYAEREGAWRRIAVRRGCEAQSVAIAPNGQFFAAACTDGVVRLFNANGSRRSELPGLGVAPVRVVFSADSGLIAAATQTGGVRVWRTSTYESRQVSPAGANEDISVHGAGASAPWMLMQGETSAAFVDVRSGAVLANWPDSLQLVGGSLQSTRALTVDSGAPTRLNVVGVPSFRLLMTLQHDVALSSASLSPDGEMAVTVTGDNNLHIWRLGNQTLRTISLSEPLQVLSFSRGGGRVAYAAGGVVHVFDFEAGAEVARRDLGDRLQSISLFPDGRTLLYAVMTDRRYAYRTSVWPLEQPEPRCEFAESVDTSTLSSDGSSVLSVSRGAKAFLWRAADCGLVATFYRIDKRVDYADFSPDGSRVMTSQRYDDRIQIWDALTGSHIVDIPGESITESWFADGGRVMVYNDRVGDHWTVRAVDLPGAVTLRGAALARHACDGPLRGYLSQFSMEEVRTVPDLAGWNGACATPSFWTVVTGALGLRRRASV